MVRASLPNAGHGRQARHFRRFLQIRRYAQFFSDTDRSAIELSGGKTIMRKRRDGGRERSVQEQRHSQLARYGSETEFALEMFQSLANPVRMMILRELSRGESNVTGLSHRLKIQQPSISRHLQILRDNKLVGRRRNRNEVYYRLNRRIFERLFRCVDWLT
jgi:DNA-binding transcriptional ArsR family regulator